MKKQTPKIIITRATEATPTSAAEPTDAGVFGIHQVHQIRPSPDNRKRFNETALQELAASIKSDGVAQPILIRPVLPTPEAPEHYEIIAGERRWRASVIAGNATIPAMVRPLTDLQAAKIRILENLQREDPHPLEEAEGYEQLMMRHGYNADQLADEIKKSRSYVYGRLKLCALSTDVREQFLEDKISASTALLIARIPVPTLQVRALGEILQPWPNAIEALSYRKAVEHIQRRYMLELGTAIFPIGDAKLLASAGACQKCPKRTGNAPELYPDVSADVCTDPDCFDEKKAAHYGRMVVEANKKGIAVLEGADAVGAIPSHWDSTAEFVKVDHPLSQFHRNAPHTKNEGQAAAYLSAATLPAIARYVKLADGAMVPLYRRNDMQVALENVGACETEVDHAARMASTETKESKAAAEKTATAKQKAEAEAHAAIEKQAADETKFRIELYKRLRAKGSAGFSIQSLREFVKMTTKDYALPDDLLGDVYQFDTRSDKSFFAHIDQAGLPELQLFLIDLMVGDSLEVGYWDIKHAARQEDSKFTEVLAMAKCEGIDPAAVREELFPTPLDIESMKPGDIATFIRKAPQRINELKREIVLHRPDLVGPLDNAARRLGYIYSMSGFIMKPEERAELMNTAPAAEDAAAPEDLPGDKPTETNTSAAKGQRVDAVTSIPPVKEQLQQQLAGRTKKSAPTNAIKTPAEAWPFPKSRDAALAKDSNSSAIEEPAEAQPVATEQTVA